MRLNNSGKYSIFLKMPKYQRMPFPTIADEIFFSANQPLPIF